MKMSNALSSWKSRVKAKIDKGESWENISRQEPMLDEEEFKTFKAGLASEEAKIWTAWGEKMWDLNIGNHKCGSGGYRGKQPIWDKEDAELERLGLENNLQLRNFVRARYYWDPETMEFVTNDPDVKEFEKELVRNLPRISSLLHSN